MRLFLGRFDSMKNIKLIAWNTGLFVLLLLGLDFMARLYGLVPGHIAPSWSNFKQVDSLIEYNHFYTNEEGFIVANKDYFTTQNIAINEDGFRNKEFEAIDSNKRKILFIGDSFTWGLSAEPLSNCFADRIGKDSTLEIINLGIPVADPAQYEVLAKKYIPILQPEMVFVFLFLGNDMMPQERNISPNKPLYYFTNAGAMMANDGERFFANAHEAYQYFVNEKFFIQQPKSSLEYIAKHSAIAAKLYALKVQWNEKVKQEKSFNESLITANHLLSIVQICKENNCNFHLVIIPRLEDAGQSSAFFKHRYSSIFNDTLLNKYCFLPASFSSSYYTPNPDGHLNNLGHTVLAKEIKQLIRQ